MTVDFTRSLRGACSGEKFAHLLEREVDDLGAGFVDEALRGADHEFDIAAAAFRLARCVASGEQARFVEHPLRGAVEQDGVVQFGDLAIEPEVNAGDRAGFEVGELFAQGRGVGVLGQYTVKSVEGQMRGPDSRKLFPVGFAFIGRESGPAMSLGTKVSSEVRKRISPLRARM
jgi:hypothetical protein